MGPTLQTTHIDARPALGRLNQDVSLFRWAAVEVPVGTAEAVQRGFQDPSRQFFAGDCKVVALQVLSCFTHDVLLATVWIKSDTKRLKSPAIIQSSYI